MPTKQKSGLYRARIKVGVDLDGKDVYKYVSGKTQKELEANRRKAIEYYIEGSGMSADVLFGPFAIKWYRIHKEPTIKPGTRNTYRTILNKYVLPVFGDRQLRAISITDIRQFMEQFSGRSSTMYTVAKTVLNSVFVLACEERIVQRNPVQFINARSVQFTRPKQKRALTVEERERIVNACLNNTDALYVALLYYLGLRQGEAAGLRWGDIDWKESTITVQRSIDSSNKNTPSSPKSEAGIRTIPVPKPLMYLLNKQRGMPDVYILNRGGNKPYTTHRRDRIWQSIIVDLCGIPDITPHHLRHNYITMCWEAGIDVYATARYVGHSNVMMTLNIYTHLSREREKESAKAVRKLFAK